MTGKRRREIGYLCSRGHFVFPGEEDGCATKRIATVYVEADHTDEDMFYEPCSEVDEDGFVWYSSSGYSVDDYESTLDAALASLRPHRD